MVGKTTFDAQAGQIKVLQQVIRAEDDSRGMSQRLRRYSIWKMPGDKRRAGHGPITHRAQQHGPRTGHRALTGAYAGRHLAGAHALEADLLILHHQIQQQTLFGTERAHRAGPPGGQAVGVKCDAQALR